VTSHRDRLKALRTRARIVANLSVDSASPTAV